MQFITHTGKHQDSELLKYVTHAVQYFINCISTLVLTSLLLTQLLQLSLYLFPPPLFECLNSVEFSNLHKVLNLWTT